VIESTQQEFHHEYENLYSDLNFDVPNERALNAESSLMHFLDMQQNILYIIAIKMFI